MDDQALLIIHDKGTGTQWERTLSEESLVIGREADCDLTLPDRQVSRHHAIITRRGERYVLCDESSRNGTFLNEALVTAPRLLQDGDEIGIASRYKITFVGSEATAPLYRVGPTRRGVYLDATSHRVWVDGAEVEPPLSAAQYHLLALLYGRVDCVVTRDEIIEAVWPEEASEGITDQAIDALVRRLRDRLTAIGPNCPNIETVRGHGFRLNQA